LLPLTMSHNVNLATIKIIVETSIFIKRVVGKLKNIVILWLMWSLKKLFCSTIIKKKIVYYEKDRVWKKKQLKRQIYQL